MAETSRLPTREECVVRELLIGRAVERPEREFVEWCALFAGSDVCFAPVLSLAEAPTHPHNVERGAFVRVDGVAQPAPLPRFSRTPAQIQLGASPAGAGATAALDEWGVDPALWQPLP